jgi:hypothetical protein
MLYFETRVRTFLLGMRILVFSGMVGYSSTTRPDHRSMNQWMVMSVVFDHHINLGGNFCVPSLATEGTIIISPKNHIVRLLFDWRACGSCDILQFVSWNYIEYLARN